MYTPTFLKSIEKVQSAQNDQEARQFFREEMLQIGWKERLRNLYRIKGKLDGEFAFFAPNADQELFLETRSGHDLILKSRQIGFCLDPETKILTADLRWIRIVDAYPGMELVAVDEHCPKGKGSSRKMRTASVVAVVKVYREAYKISFDDGRSVICTAQHPWLSKKGGTGIDWRSIESKKTSVGKKTRHRLEVGTSVKWITKPWGESTIEDGWFGGILDGEGCMSKGTISPSVCASQRHGPVWDRMVKYAKDRSYSYRIEADKNPIRQSKFGKNPVPKLCFGRMNELFKLFGQTRPTRFLSRRFWEGRWLPGRRVNDVGWSKIIAIEPLGPRELIDLQTSTGTYIAEGFVSHNTTLMCLYAFDRALWDGWSTGIMSHLKERTQSIFEMVHNTNDWFKKDWGALYSPTEESSSANKIGWLENKGSIMVAYDFQSLTIKFLHISEAAFIDQDRISNSLQSVPENGEVCLESTPNGRGGFFYDQWQNFKRNGAVASYKGFFFPWYNHYPEDKEKWERIAKEAKIKYSEREEELKELYSISDSSLCWRRWKIADFNGEEEKFENQYPVDDIACFFSGENQVFPASVMKYQESYVKDPSFVGNMHIDDKDVVFKQAKAGLWKIWELPDVSTSYTAGVDCSEGIGKDQGVISIWNRNTGYQVAELVAQLAPEELASEAWKAGHFYKYAWVCPEVNNHGHSFLAALVRKGYTKIYKRQVIDEMTKRPGHKLGWHNTNPLKLNVTNEFLIRCRNGSARIRSSTLSAQMSTFVQIGNQSGRTLKREALPGCKDDCVIAACLGIEMDNVLGPAQDKFDDWVENVQNKTTFDPDTGFSSSFDEEYT